MFIVTGSILALPEHFDELLRLSVEHVARSRTEPGCIAHAVFQDLENPLLLVFAERWESREALMAHFAVPASRAFGKAVAKLSAATPELDIYDATAIKL